MNTGTLRPSIDDSKGYTFDTFKINNYDYGGCSRGVTLA